MKSLVNQKQKSVITFPFIILVLFSSVVPLIIRIVNIEYSLVDIAWFPEMSSVFDIYSYIKSNFIIILGVLSLLYLGFNIKKIRLKDPVFIASIVFVSATLISHLLSVNSHISSIGFFERFEGSWVWISYLAVFMVIYSANWTRDQIKLFKYLFLISSTLLSIIGTFQYFGFDIILSDALRPLFTSFKLNSQSFEALYSINYKVIVQTLYHYNYVGFYLSLAIPFVISLLINEESIKFRLVYLLMILLLFFNLLGSSARGGLVGVLVSIPIIMYLNRKILLKNSKVIFIMIIILITVSTVFEIRTDGFISKRIISTFTSVSETDILKNIYVNENEVRIDIYDSIFKIDITDKNQEKWYMNYYLNNERVYPKVPDDDIIRFNENDISKVSMEFFSHNNEAVLSINILNQAWYFGYDNNKLSYLNVYGKFDSIVIPDRIGFEGREKLGSSRGYIWSRTIPLVLKRPFTGYGADVFPIVFPQNDYVGKYNAYGTTNMVIDKPHNLFLQLLINSGIFALLAYLFIFILFIIKSIKNITHDDLRHKALLISILPCLSGYFIASFFNDSTVHVSPVYWAFLALGLSIQNFEFNGTHKKVASKKSKY